MNNEMVIAIPGPWQNREELQWRIMNALCGEFMFAGDILVNRNEEDYYDYIGLTLYDADSNMSRAFEYAGQGKLTVKTLDAIANHRMIAYLHFPLAILGQQGRIGQFTEVLREVGGLAVKIESSGIAHEWEAWTALLELYNPFNLYCGFVRLTGDDNYYYSCGMHQFRLPDIRVGCSIDAVEAEKLINHFNDYQIMQQETIELMDNFLEYYTVQRPQLASGHTFSVVENGPYYRFTLLDDYRYDEENLFYNRYGIWDITPLN
jgi:hypothetical protein